MACKPKNFNRKVKVSSLFIFPLYQWIRKVKKRKTEQEFSLNFWLKVNHWKMSFPLFPYYAAIIWVRNIRKQLQSMEKQKRISNWFFTLKAEQGHKSKWYKQEIFSEYVHISKEYFQRNLDKFQFNINLCNITAISRGKIFMRNLETNISFKIQV